MTFYNRLGKWSYMVERHPEFISNPFCLVGREEIQYFIPRRKLKRDHLLPLSCSFGFQNDFAPLVSKMTSNGDCGGANNSNQACSACRHQRRKCYNCPLAPYFPSNHTQQFLNVHRLFGVSSVMKILNSLPQTKWPDAMKSILFESDAWRDDPVNGCVGIINLLKVEIEATRRELDITKHKLFYCKHSEQQQQLKRQHLQNMLASSSISMPPLGELIELVSTQLRPSDFLSFGINTICI